MIVQPRPASTIILLRDHHTRATGPQIFMVRRVVQSEFMPDVYVFPGGSVTADDRATETTARLCAIIQPDPEGRTALGTGIRAAAIRELFEEANILLAYQNKQMLAVNQETATRLNTYRQAFNQRKGSLIELAANEQLILATDQLIHFAHWITPEGSPKRYDTHFFLAIAPTAQEAVYDQMETSDGEWIEPQTALERFQAGTFPLAFPTHHLLRDLATYNSIQALLDSAAAHSVPTHQPLLKRVDGNSYVYLPAYPEQTWKI